MDSSNEVVTSPQVDDGATTSSGECNENRHKRIPVQCEEVKEAEAETKILPCGPETSVFLEEGLFVRIASFCKGKEILRFCTLTKLDMQRKCELVLKNGGIKRDPRSKLEKRSHEESWASVLRERIALDLDLVFTVGDPFVMEHPIARRVLEEQGRAYPTKILFSWPTSDKVEPVQQWSGVICGRAEQAMRTGVHRAIFTTSIEKCRIGILGAFALQGKLTQRKYALKTTKDVIEYDTYERSENNPIGGQFETGLTASLAAAHNVSSVVQVGLEIDIEQRQMRVYRSNDFRTQKAKFMGSVMIKYPSSEGYLWAVYSSKYCNGECSIERVPAAKSFASYYEPGPDKSSSTSVSVDANMVHARQITIGRFRNSSTRRHFDPYSSPPPSP